LYFSHLDGKSVSQCVNLLARRFLNYLLSYLISYLFSQKVRRLVRQSVSSFHNVHSVKTVSQSVSRPVRVGVQTG